MTESVAKTPAYYKKDYKEPDDCGRTYFDEAFTELLAENDKKTGENKLPSSHIQCYCGAPRWCHPVDTNELEKSQTEWPSIVKSRYCRKSQKYLKNPENLKELDLDAFQINGLCTLCLSRGICCYFIDHPAGEELISSFQNLYRCIKKIDSLDDALTRELDFKIPVAYKNNYQATLNVYPDAERYLKIEHSWDDEFKLYEWILRTKTLLSERDVIYRDVYWIEALRAFLNFFCYSDMSDITSPYSKKRPDSIFTYNNCQFLRYEAKLSHTQIEEAETQIKDSFFPDSFNSFPEGAKSIIGIVSTATTINIYLIDAEKVRFDKHNPQIFNANEYKLKLYKSFTVTTCDERLLFFIEMLKILRWVSAIKGPNGHFHLTPNEIVKTPNGHTVQWVNGCIIKTFNMDKTNQEQLDRMKEVYAKNLFNIEWGEFCFNKTHIVKITRIGTPLMILLSKKKIKPDEALRQIDNGIAQLLELGYVHCDLKLSNIYARYEGEERDGLTVFLGDLEYLSNPDEPAPNVECCNPNVSNSSSRLNKRKLISAEELHNLQYAALKEEILSYKV